MPLFSSRRAPSPVYEPEPVPKKHGLFHRHDQPAPVVDPAVNRRSGTGLFSRSDRSISPGHRTSHSLSSRSSLDTTSTSGHHHHRKSGGGLLHRSRNNDVDPSILQARERVMDAEHAEAQADRAREEAKLRVREAREHAKRVEIEAEEEARRAHIKQQHVKEVVKRGKGLGRHGV